MWTRASVSGPLPMEDIAKMADECLRDIDEDEEDGNVEEDQDLLVFFNCFLNPRL